MLISKNYLKYEKSSELPCLKQGIESYGQIPSDKAIGERDDAFSIFFSKNDEGKHI